MKTIKAITGYSSADAGIMLAPVEIVASIPTGCGNGELTWAQVKAVIEPILDDRFIVMTYEG